MKLKSKNQADRQIIPINHIIHLELFLTIYSSPRYFHALGVISIPN
uniref:Uncharacterized protein n=1 Tax=Siphoviridae sp. ctxMM9 TaxID=2827973 RepID=A0A8S5T6N7_9CAUD|nr:MAG TPA: hypothetical protein [Siphoviridae sp. ctxMM9]